MLHFRIDVWIGRRRERVLDVPEGWRYGGLRGGMQRA